MELRASLYLVCDASNELDCRSDWHAPAGEILAQSLSQLERDIHPVVIISAYNKALKEALLTW